MNYFWGNIHYIPERNIYIVKMVIFYRGGFIEDPEWEHSPVMCGGVWGEENNDHLEPGPKFWSNIAMQN